MLRGLPARALAPVFLSAHLVEVDPGLRLLIRGPASQVLFDPDHVRGAATEGAADPVLLGRRCPLPHGDHRGDLCARRVTRGGSTPLVAVRAIDMRTDCAARVPSRNPVRTLLEKDLLAEIRN
mgnify:CR=1 FL=1